VSSPNSAIKRTASPHGDLHQHYTHCSAQVTVPLTQMLGNPRPKRAKRCKNSPTTGRLHQACATDRLPQKVPSGRSENGPNMFSPLRPCAKSTSNRPPRNEKLWESACRHACPDATFFPPARQVVRCNVMKIYQTSVRTMKPHIQGAYTADYLTSLPASTVSRSVHFASPPHDQCPSLTPGGPHFSISISATSNPHLSIRY